MERKVLFFDIDGTLVYDHKAPSAGVVAALRAAKQKGHYIFICTGRNTSSIDAELMDIGFDGLICSAGSYVKVGDEVVYEAFIDDEIIADMVTMLEEKDVLYSLEATDCSYAEEELVRHFAFGSDMSKMNSEMQRMYHTMRDRMQIRTMDKYRQEKYPIHKISYIAKTDADLQAIKEKYGKTFQFIIHEAFSIGTVNGEIMAGNITKATGIEKVVSYLGLDMKDTIGFGDSMNDMEMIAAVAHGVVMDNGSVALKEIADTICPSVEKDGLVTALQELHLI